MVTLFASLNTRYTKNRITNAQQIDENFVQTTMPVNVDYDLGASAYFSFSTPIRPLNIKTELSTDLIYNRGQLLINQNENTTSNWNNRHTLIIENRAKTHIDWVLGATVNFTSRHYSESDHLDQNFLNFNYYSDISKDFGDRWRMETSFDYMIYPEQSFAQAIDLALWKASVSINFLKRSRGQLKLSVVDILNQNKGINRSTNLNYYEEQRIASLGRYAMLTFAYSFSGFGKKEGVIHVEERRRR
jgi:hypothetical protein